MKGILGIFIILLFYSLGQAVSYLINGFIPGNIIGMMLLFFALYFKLIKPEKVEKVASALTRNMALFFLPAGVGLLESFDLISQFWASILIVSVVSTILVIVVVALVQEKMEEGKR